MSGRRGLSFVILILSLALTSLCVSYMMVTKDSYLPKFAAIRNSEDIFIGRSVAEKIVFMITTTTRPQGVFYINSTLSQLQVARIPPSWIYVLPSNGTYNNEIFLSFVADMNDYEVNILDKSLVYPPKVFQRFHFSVSELDSSSYKIAEGDSNDRKLWRINEAYDFKMLAYYVLRTCLDVQWFVYLQDDALCKHPSTLLSHLWNISLELKFPFCPLHPDGNVAFLIHRTLLEGFVGYLATRYYLYPIDWLLADYLKSHGVDKNPAQCKAQFIHIGKISSFPKNTERVVS